MKNSLRNSITYMGLLLLSFGTGQAVAQEHDGDRWYQTRDEFYRGNDWRMHLLVRVRSDLDRVQETAFDRRRTPDSPHQQKVSELQSKLSAGRYDDPQLTEVVTNLERILADNGYLHAIGIFYATI